MRKLFVPLLASLLFITCNKHHDQTKIDVCHYDSKKGTSHTITIAANAWPAHQAHGDLLGDCSKVATTICDQTWMVKNLDVDHYRNGDPIPQVTDPIEWQNLTTGAWCYYNHDPANGLVYGKLYNWYAVHDPRGLAPEGWHVPSHEEWTILADCLGGVNVAGGKMKETGFAHWSAPNTGATNSSGFTALPGGLKLPAGDFFDVINTSGHWWSSTEADVTADDIDAWARNIDHNGAYIGDANQIKRCGFSVRCLKD